MIESEFRQFTKQEILKDFWNTIHHNATLYAKKTAIKSKYSDIDFSSLNHQANIIASLIKKNIPEIGVGIAILGKDGAKIASSVVGVLKSQNYVITLDATFPKKVLEYILSDSNTKILLTDADNYQIAITLGSGNIEVINIDALTFERTVPNPKIAIMPDQVTHLVYTSGSTGNPKGVILDYRYLSRALSKTINHRLISSKDRIAMISSFTFVGPQTLILSCLLTGATLCQYNLKTEGFIGMGDWLNQERITIFDATPTIFRKFVSTLKSEDRFLSVRFFNMGAEKKYKQDALSYQKHFPSDCIFKISFAATETSSVSSNSYTKNFSFEEEILPAGYPLDDIEVFLWDESGNNARKGEVGEIVVKGDALAKGYWHQPELTAEKFLRDPQDPSKTLFRTGDLGRFLPDGQLQHIGRLDDLVKIKGIRIELATVESHLLSFPGISLAAAKAFEDNKRNTKLVAYFVPETGITIPVSDIRKFLADRLPMQMLPHYYVSLNDIPMNQSGKVDRAALPLPNLNRPLLANPYVPPNTELETRLVKIWEDNIGIQGIGVTDDYFELGGDSLTAVLLFVQIEEIFKRKLPVSILLTSSTIRKIAEVLRHTDISQDWSPIIPLKTQGNRPPVLFIPGKGGYPIRFQILANKIAGDNPLYAMQTWGISGSHKPFYTTEENANYFIEEIKKIHPHGPYILCGESAGGMIAYEMAQILSKEGEEIPLVVMFDTYGPGQSGTLQFPITLRDRIAFYAMLIKKHLQILLKSSLEGKREYLQVYGQVIKSSIAKKQQYSNLRKDGKPQSILPKELRKIERANIIAASRYQPKPYAGRVILFRALRNPQSIDNFNGWDKVKLGELVVHNLDCYHGNILFDPFINQVANQLNTYLAQYDAN